MKFLWKIGLLFYFTIPICLAGQRPSSLIYYDHPGATILIVDKSECSVKVLQFEENWKPVKKYACTTGKKDGEKYFEGDLRTPTGLYVLSDVWTGTELVDRYGPGANIYGVGAFKLNYPNYPDRVFYNKNGSGIWMHGTDKKEPEKTRGCVSTKNEDLLELSRFIALKKTPLIIEEEVNFISDSESREIHREIEIFLHEWRQAWESEKTDHYLSFYDENFKTPKYNFSKWKQYKHRINRYNKNRKVKISNLAIFKVKELYNIQFKQEYTSSGTKDIGQKHLYVVKSQGQYKIKSEAWERIPDQYPISTLHYAYKESSKPSL